MTREIVFRGKRTDTGEWVYGYYYSECGNTYIIENRQKEDMAKRNIPFRVKADTIGQYTGLKDRNGKEIYPGDILAASGRVIGYVKDGVRGYCYDVVYVNHPAGEKRWTLYSTVTDDFPDEIEVIGNIHDNPELLEDGK